MRLLVFGVILILVNCLTFAGVGSASPEEEGYTLKLGVGGSSLHSKFIREGNWAYVDQLIEYMQDTNVKSMRTSMGSAQYLDLIVYAETPEDVALGNLYLDNFQTYLDKCELAGIDVILLLGLGGMYHYKDLSDFTGCYPDSIPEGRRFLIPAEDEFFIMYVREMVTRFGSQISGIEVGNEPDAIETSFHGRVEDYIHLFKIAVAEIKALDPSLPVATAGLACKQPIFRSYLEAMLDSETGVHDQCDAFGLHSYSGRALEVLRTYNEVCAEAGVPPKPVWMTEFGRVLDEPLEEKTQWPFYSVRGARAFSENVLEVFSSYGVGRAMSYCVFDEIGGGDGGFNLFDWDEANSILTPNAKWEYYRAAAEKHNNYGIGNSIGFGSFDGQDMFGVSPFEEYKIKLVNPKVESAFEYVDPVLEYPVESFTIDGEVLAISFDLNDSWVGSNQNETLVLEVDVKCDGDIVELWYQSCCELDFLTYSAENSSYFDLHYNYFTNLECNALTEGLEIVDEYPDYIKGVGYVGNTNIDTLTVSPGELTTVTVILDDWMFQNGLEPRADISFVPVDNQAFEIHRVVIYPAEAPGVEYADKSSETQMAYTGQPRNAMSMDFDGNDSKDLVMTRFDDFGLAYTAGDAGLGGVPQFTDVAPEYFPSSAPSVGASGIISADFDNDGWVDFFAPNFTSGGRLFRNIQGTHYEDWTSESGLENPLWEECISEALTCSWGDYDGDGYLDLAVVAGDMVWQTDGGYRLVVLHNKGGVFDFAVIDTGEFVGNSPLWADFDNDGDLDLAIIKTVSSPLCCDIVGKNYFFNNQGDGSFVEDIYALLGEENYGVGGRVATVADYDNDGDLDIIYADESGVFVMENAPILTPDVTMELGVFVRSLKTYFDLPHGDYVGPPLDVSVMDFNLDGYQDVIVGYGDASSSQGPTRVYLLENRVGADSYRGLVDVSADVGLSGDDKFAGLAIADFNRDGFSDLYLTRKATDSFFYKAKEAFGRRQKSWVGIRLNSPHGTNNTQGLGATVVLTAGSSIQTQVVDGGSGFSSQHEAELLFGLDDYGGGVTVQVSWPSGHVQNLTAVSINQYLTITDDSPVIDNTTIQVSKVFHVATGLEDWVFTWETFNTSNTYRDEIGFNLSGVSAQCLPEHSVLRAGIGGVTVSIVPVGGGKFKHTLTYPDVECRARCTIPFTITSAVVDCISTSEERSVRTSSCLLGK